MNMYLHRSPVFWIIFYVTAALALILVGVDLTLYLGG